MVIDVDNPAEEEVSWSLVGPLHMRAISHAFKDGSMASNVCL